MPGIQKEMKLEEEKEGEESTEIETDVRHCRLFLSGAERKKNDNVLLAGRAIRRNLLWHGTVTTVSSASERRKTRKQRNYKKSEKKKHQ